MLKSFFCILVFKRWDDVRNCKYRNVRRFRWNLAQWLNCIGQKNDKLTFLKRWECRNMLFDLVLTDVRLNPWFYISHAFCISPNIVDLFVSFFLNVRISVFGSSLSWLRLCRRIWENLPSILIEIISIPFCVMAVPCVQNLFMINTIRKKRKTGTHYQSYKTT